MKLSAGRIILSDRSTLLVAVAVIVMAAFAFALYIFVNNLERKNKSLKNQLNEIQDLQKDLYYVKDIVDAKEKKIGLTKVTGVVPALQQLLDSLGLKAKVIKPLDKKKNKEFTEEDAELEIEKIDLNGIVNLLFKIENSPVPLKVKTAAIKASFENQNVFILSITASLLGR